MIAMRAARSPSQGKGSKNPKARDSELSAGYSQHPVSLGPGGMSCEPNSQRDPDSRRNQHRRTREPQVLDGQCTDCLTHERQEMPTSKAPRRYRIAIRAAPDRIHVVHDRRNLRSDELTRLKIGSNMALLNEHDPRGEIHCLI